MSKVSLVCEICNTSFDVPGYRAEKARFCSRHCMGIEAQQRNEEKLRNVAVTHGLSHLPECAVHRTMLYRCDDFDNPYYGGRGITVCDRWRNGEDGKTGFECFYVDMGPRPSDQYSVERRDGNGNYEPSNCYWATRSEQMKNRGSAVYSTIWATRRARGTVNPTRGEKVSTAKVTEADVRVIRVAEGIESRYAVAERYGITYGIVYDIQKRRTWAWLD